MNLEIGFEKAMQSLQSNIKDLEEIFRSVGGKKNEEDAHAELRSHQKRIWTEIQQVKDYIAYIEQIKQEVPEHADTLETIKSMLVSDIQPSLRRLVPSVEQVNYDAATVSCLGQMLATVTKMINLIDISRPSSEPPLSVNAAMHMAWGLTLHLSHEPGQKDLAKFFEEQFKEIWKTHKTDKHALKYLENLSAILSASLRSMGFERDVYIRYLDYLTKKGEAEIKFADDLANLSSFSADGLLSRLIALIGGGTIGAAIANLLGIQTTGTATALKETAEKLNELKIGLERSPALDIETKLGEIAAELTTESEKLSASSGQLVFIVVGALVGFSIFWICARCWRKGVIKKVLDNCLEEQQFYWERTVRPRIMKSLNKLFKDLWELEGRYYFKSEEYQSIEVNPQIGNMWVEEILPKHQLYEPKKKSKKVTMKIQRSTPTN